MLIGPVQIALFCFMFCLMDRYRNVCVWFMARTCRFPKVGTPGYQPGNDRLALQVTAGSQRLELIVPNLGTIGDSRLPTWKPQVAIARNCRFPKLGTSRSQPGNRGSPLQEATAGSQMLKLTVPNWGPRGYHCKQLPLPRGQNLRYRS